MNLTTARNIAQTVSISNHRCGLTLLAAATVCVAALAATCPATTISYGDFTGAQVVFTNVLEQSSTDPVPLFGAPIATANSLAFSPITFSSSSSNDDADITDSQLSLMMEAVEGRTITALEIDEAGDFTLSGSTTATATVGAAVFWTILELDGVALPGPLPAGSTNVVFDQGAGPNGGMFELPGDVGAAQIWTGSLNVDLQSFLAAEGLTGNITKLSLTLDNTLSTSSTLGSSAFVKKKEAQQVGITVLTEEIPEPAGAVLALLVFVSAGVFVARR